MALRTLAEPYQTLVSDIIDTMLAANGDQFPESRSDFDCCIRGLLKMFDVKRRPLAIDLPYRDDKIHDAQHPINSLGAYKNVS